MKAIAEALHALVGDRQLRERFGRAARERVEAFFSQERIASETLELYVEALAHTSPRARASA